MKIKWFGHSCFLITSAHGARILTDPFDDTVGYEVPQIAADIVSTSHQHFDHNNTEIVEGKFFLVNKTGTFSNKNIKMKGIAAFHDEHNGRERGPNARQTRQSPPSHTSCELCASFPISG